MAHPNAAHRGGGRRVGPRVGRSIAAQAMRQAQLMERPIISGIKGERDSYDTHEAQRETNAQGFAQALGEMLKGAGPATEQAYTNAAGATAGFAKGFSDAEQHQAENETSSMGDFLAKAGITGDAAKQALGKIGGTSDVLYGTSGYSPASALEREGAAFTSAAHQLPGEAVGMGEQSLSQLRGAAATQDQNFEQQIANERGKIPTLANQLLQQILSREQQQQSIDIQRGYLGNANRASQISATGVDPVTGSVKPGYYTDRNGRVLPDGYVFRNGHPVRLSTSKKAGYNLDKAMSTTQPKIFTAAKGLVTTEKSTDPLAGIDPNHPATVTVKPPYAKAAKQLFDEYKYVLRQVPRSKQAKAKRLLNQVIREALSAAGITPPPPTPDPGVAPVQPGVNP